MTPGIKAAEKAGIAHTVHNYEHDPQSAAWGLEAAEKLGLDSARVFKTLVASLDGKELIVAVVPVEHQLSMKKLAKSAGGKKAEMADKQKVQSQTGYVLGGVSPLGQKKALRTFIDDSALVFPTIFVSGGRRGLEIELSAEDLATLTRGSFHPLRQD